MKGLIGSAGQYIFDLFTTRMPFFPSNIRVALFIVLFCLIACCEQYVFITLRRLEQNNQKRFNEKWQEKITNMIANIIVYDEESKVNDVVEHFFKRFKKLPLHRTGVKKILRKELLVYHANFTGYTSEILRELYLKLKLYQAAKNGLKSRYWEKQIEAIRELTQMSVHEEADNILNYTNDENAQLRMEAQSAFVKLSSNDPFRFLDRAKERILDWHQLVLFEVITKNENLAIPPFSKWLSSKNYTVITLSLKLIDHYQQFNAIPKVIVLLNHPVFQVRKLSVMVLAKLEAQLAEPVLFKIYESQPKSLQLEILKAFGKIASGQYIHFLLQQTHSPDFDIQMNAFRAILDHGTMGKEILNELYHNESKQNKLIINHVSDRRIKV